MKHPAARCAVLLTLLAGPLTAAVPQPPLGELEPAIRSQLTARRAALDRLLVRLPPPSAAERAAGYGELGKAYFLYHLNEAAAACFAEASALAPTDFRWPYYRGVAAEELHQEEEAAAAFRAALAAQPSYAPALLRLARLEIAAERPEPAAALLARAVGAPGVEAAARFELGRLAAARRDPQAAAEELGRALALQPEATAIHGPLALALRELGRLDEARLHLAARGEQAVRFADPLIGELEGSREGASAHLEKGGEALKAGRWDEAVREMAAALDADPESLAALGGLATALAGAGDRGGAEARFRQLLAADPESATGHFGLGTLLREAGRLDEALPHLEAAVRLRPEVPAHRFGLGNVLARLGRWEEAAAQFGQLAALTPDTSAGPLGQARALLRAGRETEALAALDGALARLPADGDLLHLKARLLASAATPAVRDGRQAVELATRIFAAAPNPEHGETLAMAFAAAGRFTEASELQAAVVAALTEQAAPAEVRARAEERLAGYRRGEPCRSPWLSGSGP